MSQPQAIRVKALQWGEPFRPDDLNSSWTAMTKIGSYNVFSITSKETGETVYGWRGPRDVPEGDTATLEAAFEGAQGDYAMRVLDGIEIAA